MPETFSVHVPYVKLDGQEYTLLTEEEIEQCQVGYEVTRKQADDVSMTVLREAGLLAKDVDATEVQLSEARDVWASIRAGEGQQRLREHELVVEALSEAGLSPEEGVYSLREATTEDLAAARESAGTPSGGINMALYYAALAKRLFVSTERQDMPVNDAWGNLPLPTQQKLGMEANRRASLGERDLLFALRSRARCSKGTPSPQSA